jgi:hypothetical protein
MKKILLIFSSILLVNCSQKEDKSEIFLKYEDTLKEDSIIVFDIDSNIIILNSFTEEKEDNFLKINELISSTKNSDKKLKEIKIIKKENTCLKKELIETKKELEQTKFKLDSTNQFNETYKKKGFIKKVLDNIKGENNDTIK